VAEKITSLILSLSAVLSAGYWIGCGIAKFTHLGRWLQLLLLLLVCLTGGILQFAGQCAMDDGDRFRGLLLALSGCSLVIATCVGSQKVRKTLKQQSHIELWASRNI